VRRRQVGLHIGPGQDQRTAVPRLANQLVIPLVQHAGRIHVAAVHAECIGVDDQLRPAFQPHLAERQQRQAAQRGQQHAIAGLQLQLADRGNGLLVQEARGQHAQACAAFVVQSVQPGRAAAGVIPQCIVDRPRRRPQPLQQRLDQRNIPGR
jgi:hypothetical protein